MNCRLIVCCTILIVVLVGGSAIPATAQDAAKPPLSEQGPYGVGVETFNFVDESRGGRVVSTMVWYPADADAKSYLNPKSQAKPDMTGAPYPLVIFSHYIWVNNSNTFWIGPHLASYGFVVASPSHNDPDPAWPNLIDRPYDVLFVLDQLAALSEGNLSGVIDTDRVGVTGYSFGGRTALQLTGARIDPEYFLNWCAENHPEELTAPPSESTVLGRACTNDASRWGEITAYRAQYDPPLVEGEPWPALNDPRIRAAMPMAVCALPHFGPDSLSAVTIPIFYLMPEDDDVCGYYENPIAEVRQVLTTPDRYMLILLGKTHMLLLDDSLMHRVFRHYETAFFGLYLQGKNEYAAYLTPESAASLGGMTLEVGGE